MDERNRAKILAQLRRIYDGHFSREFGTEDNLQEREWTGRLTLLTAVTPEVDTYHSVNKSLGERFIQVRWARAGGVATGLRAMQQHTATPKQLQGAVGNLLSTILGQASVPPPIIGADMLGRLAYLGEFVALARTHVPRARNTHEIVGEPTPEGNTRLPQQFAQLARGSCVLAGRSEINDDDLALVRRAAFDSLLPQRKKVLGALMCEHTPYDLACRRR